jgi:outer membrane receptor protein involved in Fe transport
VLNVSYGVSSPFDGNKNWDVSLWSNNVTNKRYYTGGIVVASSTYQYSLYPGLPRTYGVTFRVKL